MKCPKCDREMTEGVVEYEDGTQVLLGYSCECGYEELI